MPFYYTRNCQFIYEEMHIKMVWMLNVRIFITVSNAVWQGRLIQQYRGVVQGRLFGQGQYEEFAIATTGINGEKITGATS